MTFLPPVYLWKSVQIAAEQECRVRTALTHIHLENLNYSMCNAIFQIIVCDLVSINISLLKGISEKMKSLILSQKFTE